MKYDYDLLVIGGGAAGLTTAGMEANFGAKTLMVEANKLGGDCTWTGCIPSKTLLHASKMAHTANKARAFGQVTEKPIDFSSVMEHVRNKREEDYHEADDPDTYRNMGVKIRFGRARFLDQHTVAIEEDGVIEDVTSRYIIIGAGSKAMVPPIPGLDEISYYTNETIFEVEEQPEHLGIIGAGPIGMEMAQAFQQLGTQVTVFDMLPRILSNDDEELAGMLKNRLQQEGVEFKLSASIKQVSGSSNGEVQVTTEIESEEQVWTVDALLVATGRAANHKNLDLEKAGIDHTRKGITVDDRCRTNHKHIYAAGDVTGRYQFTHV